MASQYGWSFEYVLGKTLFQLSSLGEASAERISVDRRCVVDAVRVGSHADEAQYSKYLKHLEPPKKRQKSKALKSVVPKPVEEPSITGLKYSKS